MNKLDLIEELDLKSYKYGVIQRVIGYSIDMYVVTVDSRFPTTHISYNKIKNMESVFLKRVRKDTLGDLRLSPPVDILDFNENIRPNALIFYRDLAGEYYRKDFKKAKDVDITLKGLVKDVGRLSGMV